MKGIMRYYSPATCEQLNFKQSKSLLLVIIFCNEDYRNYRAGVSRSLLFQLVRFCRATCRAVFSRIFMDQHSNRKLRASCRAQLKRDYTKCMKSSHAGHNKFSIFYNAICPRFARDLRAIEIYFSIYKLNNSFNVKLMALSGTY